ncbi:hypothetical protein K439DRAFT_1630183 [Ramaria rubella]|nr:hypothetical protein K439DRAFT_1630183 [Ramaria rubella]
MHPGDAPGRPKVILKTVSPILDAGNISWCIVGDVLLEYYGVPKIIGDIEFCVLASQHSQALKLIDNQLPEFCIRFPPRMNEYKVHLREMHRYKVLGMDNAFVIVPHHVYGLEPSYSSALLRGPQLPFPVIPLPYFFRGIATIANQYFEEEKWHPAFAIDIEYLIDGMDIDEEWCDKYLSGSPREYVYSLCTREAKRRRYGPHPKYSGNLTTYIRDEQQRRIALTVIGRDVSTEKLPYSAPDASIQSTDAVSHIMTPGFQGVRYRQ